MAAIGRPGDLCCYLEELVKGPSLTGESAAMQEEYVGCEYNSQTARINILDKLAA